MLKKQTMQEGKDEIELELKLKEKNKQLKPQGSSYNREKQLYTLPISTMFRQHSRECCLNISDLKWMHVHKLILQQNLGI